MFVLAQFVETIILVYHLKGLKGVENVFTQHSCLLKEILEDLFKGRSIDQLYPFNGSESFR